MTNPPKSINQTSQVEKDREIRGELFATLMTFRDACLKARSELYETRDAIKTTDDIEKAQIQAVEEITHYINRSVTEELEYILDTASGGGSWRRVIIDRIERLQRKVR